MGILEEFSLEGKVGVVTGGAGRYGRCIVEGACEAGARAIIASRNLENCRRTADEMKGLGYQACAYRLDQADHESVTSFTDKVFEDFGEVDFLVNNSVARPMASFDDDLANWRASMDVNATGFLDITRCFVRKMIPQKRGSIINISSIYGMVGTDLSLYVGTPMEGKSAPDYFFNKGGMINLTRYFAAICGPHNIRVNAVSPGGLFENQPEKFVERYCQRTFLGRMANREDIKGLIVFLASDASCYITGANIPLDGGFTAK